MSDRLDLGHDHVLHFFAWAPDDLPANRARYGVPLPNVPRAGAIIEHRAPDGRECTGSVYFDLPATREHLTGPRWSVDSWDPLTLSPSIQCSCGDHGFIRDGRWVPA